MKQIFYFTLFTLIIFCSTSCEKGKLESVSSNLPPTIIKTEACFSPDCMTLFIAHPTDDFFYSDAEKYRTEWLKDGDFYKYGYRLNCAHPALYKAIISFRNSNEVREITYELDSNLPE